MDRRDFLKKTGMGLGGLFTASALGLGPFANALFAAEKPASTMHSALASSSTDPVGVRLVCWFDTSGSIDDIEFKVQKQAMAKAIGSEDFRDAVFFQGGPQSIAICVADFDHSTKLRIGWVDIRKGDDQKLITLANEIESLERLRSGGTDHGPALAASNYFFRTCPWQGERNIVDILTDGSGYPSNTVHNRKDLAKDHGATVNALITLDPNDPKLEDYCRKYLVTQPEDSIPGRPPVDTGFVETVATQMSSKNPGAVTQYQQDMTIAFRKKIFREIAILREDARTMRQTSPSKGLSL